MAILQKIEKEKSHLVERLANDACPFAANSYHQITAYRTSWNTYIYHKICIESNNI